MSVNIKDLVKDAKEAVEATASAKKEMKVIERKIKVNGLSGRRMIKKVSDDKGIPMGDVFVKINFSIVGEDTNFTYTASQRLSSLGNMYLELENEASKNYEDKKVYTVELSMYNDDPNNENSFISFLPDVSEEEFMAALKPTNTKTRLSASELFKQ